MVKIRNLTLYPTELRALGHFPYIFGHFLAMAKVVYSPSSGTERQQAAHSGTKLTQNPAHQRNDFLESVAA